LVAVLKAAARVVTPTNMATSREPHCCIGALLAMRQLIPTRRLSDSLGIFESLTT